MTVSVPRLDKLLAEATANRYSTCRTPEMVARDAAYEALPALIAAVKALEGIREKAAWYGQPNHGSEFQAAHALKVEILREAKDALAPFSFEEQAVA